MLADPDTMYYHQAMRKPDKEHFQQAMLEEVQAHFDNGNFQWIPLHLFPLSKSWLTATTNLQSGAKF